MVNPSQGSAQINAKQLVCVGGCFHKQREKTVVGRWYTEQQELDPQCPHTARPEGEITVTFRE